MVRDWLRNELGAYALDSVMLDGVSRSKHDDLLVNNPYNLMPQQFERTNSQDEALF